MKLHVDAGPLQCANCGEAITDDARSPTGLSHITTGRARCDGQLRRGAPYSRRVVMAVAK